MYNFIKPHGDFYGFYPCDVIHYEFIWVVLFDIFVHYLWDKLFHISLLTVAEYSKLLESIDSEVQVQRALQEKASAEQNKLEILSLEKLKFLDDT